MKITVFTPTYNRAYLLPRLYESLKKQTFKDFEWLIVDDGSTDGTRDLVDGWINEELFDIRYYYQENGGKHRAINRGALLAKGEWFFIVDSDDYLPDSSLEIANKWLKTVEDDDSFAGVSGMCLIGGKTPKVCFSSYIDLSLLRNSEAYRGDKADIFKTKVLKMYPFPDINGEKFCAEGLVWNRIGLKYKMRYFNVIIYKRDYLEDGLTKKSLKIRKRSPTYASLLYKEKMLSHPSFRHKLRSAINYWRFVWYTKKIDKFNGIPIWSILFLPIGFCMTIRDFFILKGDI